MTIASNNTPDQWHEVLPELQPDGHKYHRGHALVVGSPLEGSGATKLTASAALRVGAGLVTVTCDATALPVYAACFTSIIVKTVNSIPALCEVIDTRSINTVEIGGGNGVIPFTRERVLALAARDNLNLVIDADAISVFQDNVKDLLDGIHERCVLTPHEAEFSRLFPAISGSREHRAKQAAQRCGAVIVLKGRHTVIASPDGEVCVNENAPPTLATAGSGDVLAGIITGLLAQGMPPYQAASAGVYIHGACANRLGHGLISSDLPGEIGAVMTELHK